MDFSSSQLFLWHTRVGALERLTPPFAPIKVLERTDGIENGARVLLEIPAGPFKMQWLAVHSEYQEGRQFKDSLQKGPFAFWEHLHLFNAISNEQAEYVDRVEYRLPLSPLSDWLAGGMIQRQLEQVFAYRHRVLKNDLRAHHWVREDMPHKILMSGASGLVGRHLTAFLTTGGHRVTPLVRHPVRPGEDAVYWNPQEGKIDCEALEGFDGVVHLAGENIGSGRWTVAQKKKIIESRVQGTGLLANALAHLKHPPKVMLSMSAVGYYGDRGEDQINESSAPGDGFLPQVAKAWESAAEPARKVGIRVVHPRLGVVLTPAGGALPKMLFPIQLGIGGWMGNGTQYVSWITMDDLIYALHYFLHYECIEGPVNLVAPQSVTNRQFTRILGKILNRPTFFKVPASALRILFGEMGEALLLSSTKIEPGILKQCGFEFAFPDLESALRHLLGRT
jgi:uncharacterized protein (TIGR01777 family)